MCCRYRNTRLEAIVLICRNKKQNGLHKTRHRSMNGVEDPDRSLHTYNHLIISKDTRKPY